MKSLVYGCAAAALLAGLAFQAHADIVVQEAPVHAVPLDDEDGAAGPQVTAAKPPAQAEPAAVKALVQPKAPAKPALTPDEDAFFATLGHRVTDAASAYESYVRGVSAIDPAFSGSVSVHKAVKTSAAYHPHQMEEGIVAYAALVALRNPQFVDSVRGMDPRFADALPSQPGQVMQVRGAREAAADVAGVLRAQGEALTSAGKAITKAAYDIQAQSWSKTPVADSQAVLDGAKASAEATRTATVPSKEKLLASLVVAPQAQGGAASGSPDVVRGLALAAMAILGRTGDGNEAAYEALLHDASSADCLKMAKLNLNQCLAVAGPHYEDVYCAGRHAVSDTGKCIAAAASGGALDAASPQPAAVPQPRLETAENLGFEQARAYGHPAAADVDEDDEDDRDSAVAAAPPEPAPRRAEAQYAAVQAAPAPQAQPQAQFAPVQPAQPPQHQAQAYQPAPQAYARNDYAQPAPQPYAPQPQYQQPQYAPQPQAYPQQPPQYAPPQQYAQQQQPYYPQQQPQYRQPQQAYGYQGQQQPYYPQQQQSYGYGAQGYAGQ